MALRTRLAMVFTWFCQERFSSMSTPKYFAVRDCNQRCAMTVAIDQSLGLRQIALSMRMNEQCLAFLTAKQKTNVV